MTQLTVQPDALVNLSNNCKYVKDTFNFEFVFLIKDSNRT